MALQVFTDGYTQFIGSVRMEGSFTDDFDTGKRCSFQWGQGSFSNNTSFIDIAAFTAPFNRTPVIPKDVTIKFRAKAFPIGDSQDVAFGDTSEDFKTFADPATFPIGLTPGVPTTVSCPVTGTVIPKTVESTGEVYIEYRKLGTSTWLQIATPIATGLSGSGSNAISGDVSGLLPGTSYEARFRIDRNTINNLTNYSAIGTFTTVAVSTTIVSPQLMSVTAQFITPQSVGTVSGGGVPNVVLINPKPVEVIAEMFIPAIHVSQQAIIEVFVQFNNVITREAIFG